MNFYIGDTVKHTIKRRFRNMNVTPSHITMISQDATGYTHSLKGHKMTLYFDWQLKRCRALLTEKI